MRTFSELMFLFLLMTLVSCADHYKKGFDDGKSQGYATGHSEGYEAGYEEGDTDGYARAQSYFESAGYNEGFSDGKQAGINQGYSQGYTVGKNETYAGAYDQGYDDGYLDGDLDGYNDGYDDGYDDGYAERTDAYYASGYTAGNNVGYEDGLDDGFDLGYDDGFSEGYDVGYDDGSFGLSIGKSPELRGYASILSLAHNDLIDYGKIPMPKVTQRGLLVNGDLLLSENSFTNKDTLKRAAVVEQYVVAEMAKQVKGKFGLSSERSLKIAKAANHFRKFSSKRSLTSEDTNAFASEIIGSDFGAIEEAYEETLKGNLLAFDSVLSKAAEKNDTSPENISLILTQYFM